MSREIDERIVSMQFDNARFEKNVQTTMRSLDNLDKSLQLKGASKGLVEVDRASKKAANSVFDVGHAAETISLKFSALQVIGTTALAHIANKAVASGERILKALTLDPITTGLQEYETQIGAVQTILANTSSKGTSLDQVNAALDELNRYADKTIYNFTEMTRNIGTFTAAGVDLDTSVKAIQGIANLAAVSGSTSTQASTAMYQLSQALAAGKVNLMDWNSVVNAGMGGEVFQNALKRTARAMGTDVDAIIEEAGSFRESLSKGDWLTTDVLTKTLEQFTMAAEEGSEQWNEFKKSLMDDGYTSAQADEILKMANTATDAATKVKTLTQLWDVMKEAAQSGWAQTWEIIVGDFEEAKELWTPLSEFLTEFINNSAESRNALLGGALDSNWGKLIDKLGEAGYTADDLKEKMIDVAGNPDLIQSVITKHGSLEKAVRSGAISSDLLSKAVANLNTELVDLSKIDSELNIGKTGDDVKQMQEALHKLGYDLGSAGIDGIFGEATLEALKNFQEAEGLSVTGILDAGTLDALKKSTSATNEATAELVESTKGLIEAIKDKGGRELLIESFTNIGKAIMAFIAPIKEAFREIFPPATAEQVFSLIERFKKFTETLTISAETAEKIKNVFKGIFSVFKIGIDIVKNLISGFTRIIGNSSGIIDMFLSGASAIGTWIAQLQSGITETNVFSKIINTIVEAFNKIVSVMSDIGKSGLSKIPSIFSKIGHAIQTVFSGITSYIGSVFEVILDAFRAGDLEKALDLITQGLFANLLVSIKKNFELMFGAIGESVNIFSEIGDLFNTLKGTIGTVASVFDSLKDTLVEYQRNLKASSLIKIGIAIGILAAAVWVLSGLPTDRLATAIGGITLLMTELSIAVNYMNGSLLKSGGGLTKMLGLSVAILILAAALKSIANIEGDKLQNGVEAIAGLLISLTAAMKIMSIGQKRLIKGATGIVIFAYAVKILAAACKDLSSVDEDSLNRGILAISTIMTVLVGSMKVMSDGQERLVKGMTGVVVFAAAIKILASVCKELGAMDEDSLTRGLIAVSTMIAVINMFLNNAKFSKGSISSSIGIVIVAAAIKILESSVKELATLDADALNKGLTAVSVLLAAMAAFTNLNASTSKSLSSAASIVAMAYSLQYIVDAVSGLGSLSMDSINKGLGAIGGVLLAFAASSQIMAKGNMLDAASTLVTVAYVLPLITAALLELQQLSGFDIAGGLIAIGGSLAILCGAMFLMEDSLKGAFAILVASSALVVLSTALAIIGTIGFIGIAAGLVAMALSFTTIGIAAKLLNPISLIKLAGALTLLGASFAVFAGGIAAIGAGVVVLIGGLVESIEKMEGIGWKGIGKGVLILVGVFGALAVAGLLLKPFSMTLLSVSVSVAVFALSLAAIAGTITLVGMALSSLALIGEESVGKIVGSLKVLIIGILGIIVDIVPVIGDTIKKILSAIIDVIVTSAPELVDGLLTMLIEVLKSLSDQMPIIVDFLVTFVIGIIDSLTKRVPELLDSIGNFINEVVKWFTEKLKGIDASTFMNLLEGFGAIAAIMVIANAIKSLTGGALIGVLGMSLVIAEIGVLVAAFGALAQIPGLKWLVEEGGDLLQSIGTAIGQFVGGIVGGIAEGFTSSLPEIGTNLSDFMDNLGPFIDGVSKIPDGLGGKIAALSGAIIALSAADLLNAISSFLTGGSSFADLGADLSAFMENAAGFIDGASTLNEGMLTGVQALAQAIYILTAAEILDGLASWVTGSSSLSEFGSQLPELGKNLAGFTTNLGTFSDSQVATVECAAGALVALAKASSEIPNEGGVWGWLAGENSLSDFSNKLPGLGTDLASFVTNLGTFTSDQVTTVECAGNAIKALATAADEIPNEGGLWSWLAGENSLSEFSGNLPQLGTDLAAFVANLGTFTTDQVSTVECAGKAVAALATAADDIPNEGGLWGWLAGDSSLTEFGDQLSKLGTDLAAFVDNLGTFGEDAIATTECAVAVVKALAELSDTDLDDASDNMWIWGDTLDDLAMQIVGFIDSLNGMGNFSAALSNFESLVDATKEITASDAATVLGFSDALIQLGVNGVTSFINAFDDMSDDVIKAGETMVTNFIDGAESKSEDANTAVTTIANSAALKLLDTYTNFYKAGAYAVSGFCAGIDDNSSDAYDSGYALGMQAKAGAEAALDENSPSKEFYKIGDFAGMPFVKALQSYVGESYDAGYDIGDSAKSGLKDTLSRISDFMSSGVDYNPTISPVLNLSNVRAGVRAIGNMMDMGASVGVMANLSAINSTMNHRNQNGANDDVIRAIDRLGSGLGSQTGDTYNINGLSYSNNAELEDALKVIMRYMTVEGRV